ncbi:MAG: DUF2974 domain-containing protein, partial [Candidatus Gastranaerophilales bacterium]|nr:DUF2974 domain-containing protein [Candidatus Gastranaerophilales bacterium]
MTITKELCQQLAHCIYGGSYGANFNLFNGFIPKEILIKDVNNQDVTITIEDAHRIPYYRTLNGLVAAFYYNETLNEGVIAYRGTERNGLGENVLDLKDWQNDLMLMQDKIPTQFYDALYFYNTVYNQYKDKGTTIYITGHSLGGALAQLVSSCSAGTHQTFTFNAPGVMHLLDNIKTQTGTQLKNNYSHITNYSVMNDWCGMVHTHIGKLLVFAPQSIRPISNWGTTGKLAPFIDTHEWILNASLNKAVPKPIGFNESEGLSLWYYDENNAIGNVVTDVTLRPLVQEIIARISIESLENALKILRNNPKLIEYDFTYKANGKTYYLPKANGKTIAGTTKAEVLFGSSNDDILQGNSGNDELHGFEGNDTLRGGSGDDTLYAGDGDDTIYGDAGNDKLFAGMGNNKLYGGSGNDNLHDGPGKNYLSGGTGYDVYITGRYSGGATIGDSDGIGAIQYDGIFLKRATRMPNEEHKWRDDYGNIFKYASPNLIINNNITVQSFKNCDLGIYLYKEDGTPEPTIPGGNSPGEGEGGEGSGSGSGSGGGDGSVIGSGKGTGESNFDHDDEGNLIDGKNPEEGGGVPSIGEQLGPKPGGGVGDVPPTAGPANVLPVDPLIFDLDFNDIISLSKPEQGRNFDIDNDGIAQKVAWINSGDAILVCDRNGNGTIDNGLELFGDNTLLENGEYAKSGIEALAEFDTNNDGKITLADLKFSDLKLLKSDNTTITLEEAGIKEISLSYTTVNKTDANGNRQIKEAKFITNDDVEHIYGEFMLNQNIYQSVSAEIIPVSDEVAALPDVAGSGLVHSLHQAIMRDVSGEILAALKAFLNEENIDTKHSLCEQLIYKWAGTENVSTTGRGTLYDGRKLATIETFAGTYLQGTPKTPVRTQAAADILEEGFDNFFGFVYSSLAIQTHMSELFSNLSYKLDKNDKWKVNLDGTFPVIEKYMREAEERAWKELEETLENTETEGGQTEDTSEPEIEVDYTYVYDKISDFVYVLKYFNYLKAFDWQKYVTEYNVRFGNNVGYAFLKYLADYPGTKGNDSIHGDSRNNIIYGDEGNDTLYGYYGHDTLYGGDGNDSLRGAWGNDVLYAGRGNDTLDGYQDDDTYIINPAEINGTSYTKIEESKGNDTVIFQGVNSDEITAQSNNQGTIYILFTNYPDNKIEIPYQNDTAKRIETFIFEDVALTFDEFKNKYLLIHQCGSGNDSITMPVFANEIHGNKGNDSIHGDSRNNILYGDEGNDTLYGYYGHDTL